MLFSIFDVLRIFVALQMFFYKALLKWGKNGENVESTIFFEAQKYYFVFESRLNFLFQMVIFATLFRRCPTLWKSTLKTTTLFRRCLTLFNSTLKYTTLLNVVDFNVDVRNVVSTLIWRCAMSRRHINLKTTLNRRWSVCWVPILKQGVRTINAQFIPTCALSQLSFVQFRPYATSFLRLLLSLTLMP